MKPDILCLGEPLFEFSQLQGEYEQRRYLQGYGGDTSNAAIAAARQGATVGYLTAVGNDTFGNEFIELWKREGVDVSAVKRDTHAHTGIYFISHSERGHEFTYFRDGSAASRMQPRDLDESAIADAKVLHVSGISQAISDSACDTVFEAIQYAKDNGVKVSYDTNLRLKLWSLPRAKAVIHSAIAQADIALPSLEDAEQLTGMTDPGDIIQFYLDLGTPLVVLKLGAKGAIVATQQERLMLPPYRVEALDATGAGDTFAGAFLARYSAGESAIESVRYANVAAALSTTGYGAVQPMPRDHRVLAALTDAPSEVKFP